MSIINITECVIENTVSTVQIDNITKCSCHRAFYGTLCENHYSWYTTSLIVTHILHTSVILFVLLWCMARIKYIFFIKKNNFNLSNISLIFNIIATFSRLAYLWLPSRSVLLSREPEGMTYAQILLVHFSNSLWTMTSLLIMGFWYDVFRKIGNRNLKTKTKLLIIVISSIILLATCIGMFIILFMSHLFMIGLTFFFISLILGISIMIYFIVRLGKLSHKIINMNKKKYDWVYKTFVCILITAITYVVSIALTIILSNNKHLNIIPDILFRICEASLCVLIMFSLDYKCKALRSMFMTQKDTIKIQNPTITASTQSTSKFTNSVFSSNHTTGSKTVTVPESGSE